MVPLPEGPGMMIIMIMMLVMMMVVMMVMRMVPLPELSYDDNIFITLSFHLSKTRV